jgi:choline dehydrogenase-like flavoprotein
MASSAVNFGVFTVGARDDYEECAQVTGDASFGWEPTQRRLKDLESFDGRIPPSRSEYAAPALADHSMSGPIQLSYVPDWERDIPEMIDALEQAGYALNPDSNLGDPIGLSIMINPAKNGVRTTAKDLITPAADNLTVVMEAPVQRVGFERKKAMGAKTNYKTCAYT